jgi:hypothetical protein
LNLGDWRPARHRSGVPVKTLYESTALRQAGAMRGMIRAARICATFWENDTPEKQNPPEGQHQGLITAA